MRLAFGECTFDPAARELTRGGRRVELSPKALELLLALLEARPRALSRAELHDHLWPRTFVSAASLRQLVMELRKALGDDPHAPRLVRTVPRFGYAFSGEACAAERRPAPWSLLCGTRERPLWLGENLLGRAPDAVVPLASGKASRRHARLVASETEAVLEDLGSKNGTRLNGVRVTRAVALQPGDRIEVGHELLVFCASAMGATQTDFDV